MELIKLKIFEQHRVMIYDIFRVYFKVDFSYDSFDFRVFIDKINFKAKHWVVLIIFCCYLAGLSNKF